MQLDDPAAVARIEDVDGSENFGDFQTKDVPLQGDSDCTVIMEE
jgi:hypothetical protein